MKKFIPLLLIFVMTACTVPQWRVAQAKVPEPLQKPAKQVEGERQAADLIARTVREPEQIIPVAQKLSASLGAPDKPITTTDLDKARDEALLALLKGMQQQQDALAKLNAQLAKYEGKKIEGTGVNVFGFAVSLPVLGVIALCIFCPGAIGVLFWLLKKARGALAATVQGVQDFKKENPQAAKTINIALDGAQDKAHKLLVKKIKSKL